MNGKIAISETLSDACRMVLDRKSELFRVGLVLILGIFALGIFALDYLLPLMRTTVPQVGGPADGQPMADPRFLPALLLMVFAEFLLIAVFAVGWHRLILLGPGAGGGLGIGFGRRELAYLGRLWLCFLGVLLFSAAFSIVEIFLAGLLRANTPAFVIIAMLGFSLVATYVIGRVGLSFAGLSVDRPFSFAASWQATTGEGFRILAVYVLLAALWFLAGTLLGFLASVLGLGDAAPYAFMFVNAVVSSAFIALLVTVNAILFRRLSGWSPGSLRPAGS